MITKNNVMLFNEIINIEEFELVRYKNGYWGLRDRQGANLGGIETESFNTIAEILDRMEIYHIDYFENAFVESFEIDNYNDYLDLVAQCREKIKTGEYEDEYDNSELKYLELIGNAPNITEFNIPLEQIEGLYYEQLQEDYPYANTKQNQTEEN